MDARVPTIISPQVESLLFSGHVGIVRGGWIDFSFFCLRSGPGNGGISGACGRRIFPIVAGRCCPRTPQVLMAFHLIFFTVHIFRLFRRYQSLIATAGMDAILSAAVGRNIEPEPRYRAFQCFSVHGISGPEATHLKRQSESQRSTPPREAMPGSQTHPFWWDCW